MKCFISIDRDDEVDEARKCNFKGAEIRAML
jgi:hypothetical protein